tara:strand:+ start:502 stop:747 length:246 start_codon:yes stop_codon:yes gene_type:complete
MPFDECMSLDSGWPLGVLLLMTRGSLPELTLLSARAVLPAERHTGLLIANVIAARPTLAIVRLVLVGRFARSGVPECTATP